MVKSVRSIPKTGTTFKPKTVALTPKQFGKSASPLEPATDVDATSVKFLAAQFQHRVCNALREGLLSRGLTINGFATQYSDLIPGMGYDRLVRVLRGDTLMQIADCVAWAEQFPGVRAVVLDVRSWPLVEVDLTAADS
jgi:hypothetical protein